jgi:hypothetical protein
MAKSLRSNGLTENGNSSNNLPFGSFWEHWFSTQPATQSGHLEMNSSDEHRIWENAISFADMGGEKSKA